MKDKVKLDLTQSELRFLASYFMQVKKAKDGLISAPKIIDVKRAILVANLLFDWALKMTNKLVSNPYQKRFKISLKENTALALWIYLCHLPIDSGTYEDAVLSSLFLTIDEKLT